MIYFYFKADDGKEADFNLSFEDISHGDDNDFEKYEFAHAAYPLQENHGQVTVTSQIGCVTGYIV